MIERGNGTKQITWTAERIEHLRQAFEIDGKEEAEIRLELNLMPGQTISSDSAVFYKARSMKLHRSPGFKSQLRHTLRVSFLQQQANARASAMKRLAEFEEQERSRAREAARIRSVPRVRLPYKPPAQVDPTPWAVLRKPAKPFSMLGGRTR